MNIEIIPAGEEDMPVLEQLMELYCHDMSEFLELNVDHKGRFGYKYLDLYWTEPDRYTFFIVVDGRFAGFVLVNKNLKVEKDPDAHAIAEFFVMRRYRQYGIGKFVARRIFDMYPGKWEISVLVENKPATRFWKDIVGGYTMSKFQIRDFSRKDRRCEVSLFSTAVDQ
jgi:predicted acetyltransferase